ncbi:Transposase IS116/IS110/IS902 family protein [Jannaschia seosinensis]|uniref:Transposase IS116/IS110/IS902 family protein n=2 Tax=Jannaschia seosinensis TaxID=313367 RepID=A0A0M7BEJ5_9RHOB|nr:IS110 family transposase [Jannaschia seosinensis]CUH40619.1 Transposase IS116/IS110/IS902 family protein [Jannaschia seosinensis]
MRQDTIGIDISKATLDVHRLSTDEAAQFSNSSAGLRALRRWIGKQMPDLVVFEATGAYHAALERHFTGVLPLVKVNPLQARRFAQARGTRAKTDAVDARILAVMGAALDLVPDAPEDSNHHEIKDLQIARMALIKERTRLLNRSKTQTLALLKRQSKARLAQVKRQLVELEEALLDLLLQCPKRARAFEVLCSIPGLGRITAVAILVECPELGTLTRKQIASLAGLAPMTRQSGQWRGAAFIQGGRKFLRDALYMPALVAARHNPDLRQRYHAMIKAGKPAKVALTALMRKLIELANALVQQDRKWTPKPA